MRASLAAFGAGLAVLGAVLAAGCEAPIPGRDGIEADAAFRAGEWRDDAGGVWRVRINGRRFSATAMDEAHDGQSMRGQISEGVLTYTLEDRQGEEIGQGKAWVAEGDDALYRLTGEGGNPSRHGLMHFNHAPETSQAALPAGEASPTPVPTPGMTSRPPVETPSTAPSAPQPQESSPTPDPFSPSPTPSSSDPADPLDLRPPPQ